MNAIFQRVLPSLNQTNDPQATEFIIVEGSVRLNDEFFRLKKFRSLLTRLLTIHFVDLNHIHLNYESPNLHLEVRGELSQDDVDAVQLVLTQMENMIADHGLGDPEYFGLYFPVHIFPISVPKF